MREDHEEALGVERMPKLLAEEIPGARGLPEENVVCRAVAAEGGVEDIRGGFLHAGGELGGLVEAEGEGVLEPVGLVSGHRERAGGGSLARPVPLPRACWAYERFEVREASLAVELGWGRVAGLDSLRERALRALLDEDGSRVGSTEAAAEGLVGQLSGLDLAGQDPLEELLELGVLHMLGGLLGRVGVVGLELLPLEKLAQQLVLRLFGLDSRGGNGGDGWRYVASVEEGLHEGMGVHQRDVGGRFLVQTVWEQRERRG
jgi:hypothetical protein